MGFHFQPVKLSASYLELQSDHQRYLNASSLPLVINIHGSGGTDRPIGFGGTVGEPRPLDGLPDHIRIAPRAMSGTWWSPAALDALLDSWLATYPIDKEAVSLTGFSMGGMGTWAWALASPHYFSAIAPMVDSAILAFITLASPFPSGRSKARKTQLFCHIR